MNVALLLAGPYRGNDVIIEAHHKFIGQYDTYVSCLSHYMDSWNNSNWNITQLYETPSIDIKTTNWFMYRDDAAGQSGFWQFWNLKSVINNVPKTYDFYIKSRSDLLMKTNLKIDFTQLDAKTLYSSASSFHKDFWGDGWVNDEFYIGSGYVMDVIANFVTDYYKTPNRHGLCVHIDSNERCLRTFLEECGVHVDKIHHLIYSKDYSRISVPSGESCFQLEKI